MRIEEEKRLTLVQAFNWTALVFSGIFALLFSIVRADVVGLAVGTMAVAFAFVYEKACRLEDVARE